MLYNNIAKKLDKHISGNFVEFKHFADLMITNSYFNLLPNIN